MMTYQRANRLWMQMLLRDRFKTILLKRLQQGQWISPADFKKYTTPHTHHCFRLYMNRPCAFRRYLSKRSFHKIAKAAVFRLASTGVALSRLNTQLQPFPREKKFFSPNEPNLPQIAGGWKLEAEICTNEPNSKSHPEEIRTFALSPLPFDRVLPNEPNFTEPSVKNLKEPICDNLPNPGLQTSFSSGCSVAKNLFSQNKPNFQTPPNERKPLCESWLLKAGGWPLSQKTNPNKANLQDGLVIPFSVFMARLSAFEQSCPYG